MENLIYFAFIGLFASMFADVLYQHRFIAERAAASRMRTRMRFNALVKGHVQAQVTSLFETFAAYGTHVIRLDFAVLPFFMKLQYIITIVKFHHYGTCQ